MTNTYVVKDKGNDAAEEILQTFFIEQYKTNSSNTCIINNLASAFFAKSDAY
ncbi:MAG: hypothetical protein WCF23_06220 [Candidatus Nitrosopolaris sp.]